MLNPGSDGPKPARRLPASDGAASRGDNAGARLAAADTALDIAFATPQVRADNPGCSRNRCRHQVARRRASALSEPRSPRPRQASVSNADQSSCAEHATDQRGCLGNPASIFRVSITCLGGSSCEFHDLNSNEELTLAGALASAALLLFWVGPSGSPSRARPGPMRRRPAWDPVVIEHNDIESEQLFVIYIDVSMDVRPR